MDRRLSPWQAWRQRRWRSREEDHLIACAAICWHWLMAAVSFTEPAITAEISCVHRLPTSWNCGMPTYCTPGRSGRLVVPGLVLGAAFIAASVIVAKALAAFLY